jgi:hypothetical protein
MRRHLKAALGAVVVLNAASLAVLDYAQAGGMGDIMNPSKWFGGSKDRGDYYGGPYGYGGGPGYYGGGPGYWGGPGYYGAPYGYGGGYGYPYAPPQIIQVPAQSSEKQAPPPPKAPE